MSINKFIIKWIPKKKEKECFRYIMLILTIYKKIIIIELYQLYLIINTSSLIQFY